MSVNVREIDAQHQKLIEMISEFCESVSQDARAALRDLLDSLMEYAPCRFATMENFFKRFEQSDKAYAVSSTSVGWPESITMGPVGHEG